LHSRYRAFRDNAAERLARCSAERQGRREPDRAKLASKTRCYRFDLKINTLNQ
jgi:hypothetical protein